ncbi:MAG: hypothetical protein ACKVP0_14510 [Pirellulaceae bacterium]
MRILISDLIIATCDLTSKEGVECLRLQLDEHSPEINCRPGELIKLLRLKKSQQVKADAFSPPVSKPSAK